MPTLDTAPMPATTPDTPPAPIDLEDAPDFVLSALLSGEMTAADLSARRLSKRLGRTTGSLYHRWGSLDGFLHAIVQRAFGRMSTVAGIGPDTELGDLAEGWLRFANQAPELYGLMFERTYDWSKLCLEPDDASRGLAVWRGFVQRFEALGSDHPADDARIFYAALHGLTSLVASGRANVDDIETSDLDAAIRTARRLARTLTGASS
jgi:AcrR family transcriptional regulator